jgi:GTP-binding protein YchF
MKAMIVGLPMSGKSTLFSAVTGVSLDPYPPPDVHPSIVHVPDHRLTYLAKLGNPKKVTEATIEFWDVPGCSLDDPKGVQEWRRHLPTVRQADLIVVVVRDFVNAALPAYRDRIDPQADFAAMWDELIFADLDTVTTRLERIEKALKKPTKSHEEEKRQLALLTRCREALENEAPLSSVITMEEEQRLVSSFAFLTQKPLVCVRNVSDDRAASGEGLTLEHIEASLALSASIEAEIAMLDPEDRPAFLADLGLEMPARDRLIRACCAACGMITFMTMNAEEARAWIIREGSTAVEAAAKVHTDFARGFIRAETVASDDLVEYEDFKGARAAGKVRKEGKSYVVKDGDVLNILYSV